MRAILSIGMGANMPPHLGCKEPTSRLAIAFCNEVAKQSPIGYTYLPFQVNGPVISSRFLGLPSVYF
jgi:hypothetical protein